MVVVVVRRAASKGGKGPMISFGVLVVEGRRLRSEVGFHGHSSRT